MEPLNLDNEALIMGILDGTQPIKLSTKVINIPQHYRNLFLGVIYIDLTTQAVFKLFIY